MGGDLLSAICEWIYKVVLLSANVGTFNAWIRQRNTGLAGTSKNLLLVDVQFEVLTIVSSFGGFCKHIQRLILNSIF